MPSLATPPSEPSTSPDPLPYALPTPTYANKVWAAVAILFAGLGLIVLGGCFLIGVLLLTSNGFGPSATSSSLTPRAVFLLVILYALAAVSFISATLILLAGLRALFRIIRA